MGSSVISTQEIRNFLLQTDSVFRSEYMAKQRPPDFQYFSLYGLVAEKGIEFRHEPLNPPERDELLKILKKVRRYCFKKYFSMGECFKNAFNVSLFSDGAIKYVEGFAAGIIPTLHAWSVFKGKVIDLTWREKHHDPRTGVAAMIERINWNIINSSYIGMMIPLKYMMTMHDEIGIYGSALDDYERKWPILKQGTQVLAIGS